MSQAKSASENEKRAEYDFSDGVRGKHHEAYKNRGLLLLRTEALRTGSGPGSGSDSGGVT